MPVVDLTLSYDGGPFSGFARQKAPDGTDTVRTVQGELEQALALLYRREVATVCAGRTDAGVHALGQHASFEIDTDEFALRDLMHLRRSLNGILSDEISVRDARVAPDGFSARFDCKRREYRYLLADSQVHPVLLRDRCWWVHDELDVSAMQQAAGYLIGEHDFTSLCPALFSKEHTTVRLIECIEITREVQLGEDCIQVRVVGNAFLHNMVRIIVGTLVEVGRGKRDEAWVGEALAARNRAAAGPTAPPEGLIFWNAEY